VPRPPPPLACRLSRTVPAHMLAPDPSRATGDEFFRLRHCRRGREALSRRAREVCLPGLRAFDVRLCLSRRDPELDRHLTALDHPQSTAATKFTTREFPSRTIMTVCGDRTMATIPHQHAESPLQKEALSQPVAVNAERQSPPRSHPRLGGLRRDEPDAEHRARAASKPTNLEREPRVAMAIAGPETVTLYPCIPGAASTEDEQRPPPTSTTARLRRTYWARTSKPLPPVPG